MVDPMADIFTGVTTVLTNILTYIGNVATTITAQPILLLFVIAVPVISFAVGLLSRLVNRV